MSINTKTEYKDFIVDHSDYKFFYVTDDHTHFYKIKKLAFQTHQPDPATLRCCVVDNASGKRIVRQDLLPIISDLYKEGEEYDFHIKNDFTNQPKGYYEVEDDNGLYFHLYVKSHHSFTRGQHVRCRFSKLRGMSYQLHLSAADTDSQGIPFWEPEKVMSPLSDRRIRHELFMVFNKSPELDEGKRMLCEENPEWIIRSLEKGVANIPLWLKIESDKLTTDFEKTFTKLYALLDIAIYLLEESEFLRFCELSERMTLQKRLSEVVSSIKNYITASELISGERYMSYIDSLLTKLRKSGYLYHPSKQFTILMTIFKIRPELINQRMGQIFESMSEWDIENWKMEPFRSAFVELIEMYVSMKSPQINEMPDIETKDDNQAVGRIVMGLAIQMLLGDPEIDNIDFNKNRSMFYRYMSMLNRAARSVLTEKSYNALMGGQTVNEFTWSDIRQFTLVVTKAGNPNPSLQIDPDLHKTFSGNGIRVDITADGITILPAGFPRHTCQSRLPGGLFTHHNIEVALPCDIKTPSRSKIRDLAQYKTMWHDIRMSLRDQFPDHTPTYRDRLILPEPGDYVDIIIDDIDETETYLHCKVVQPNYTGQGWITMNDIVRYNLTPDPNYFIDPETGEYIIMKAMVVSAETDDELEFSMFEPIIDHLRNSVNSQDEFPAVVTDIQPKYYNCITSDGWTVRINRNSTTPTLRRGETFIVRALNYIPDLRTFLGEIIDSPSYVDRIDKWDAFTRLINNYGTIQDQDDDPEEVCEADEIMDVDEILELAMMFRRLAADSPDYVESFNYLSVAALLAEAVEGEESELADLCHTHTELLLQLQYFAVNRRIDTATLEELHPRVNVSPLLERLFTRLEIVASIGDPENDPFLWNIITRKRNEFEVKLARSALSINMMDGEEMIQQRKAVLASIGQMLNANREERTLKYYGDGETKTLEFKTSLVFPNKKEMRMRPDPQTQETEILQIICGFLNASGGTLYLGVNDQGYEAGLANDLAFHKMTLPQLALYLDNLVSRRLGSSAADRVDVAADSGTNFPVLSVTIRPCRHVVELDGTIFVRQSSSTRPKLGEDREIFIRDRMTEYNEIIDNLFAATRI